MSIIWKKKKKKMLAFEGLLSIQLDCTKNAPSSTYVLSDEMAKSKQIYNLRNLKYHSQKITLLRKSIL